ncbi:MAG: hypothetical protein ACI9GW_001457 [Halieaceae bacterium]|jgi:hypothetical protein
MALKQWDTRSLLWDELSTGSTRIQLILATEIAQAFLDSVEHSLNQTDAVNSDTKIAQRLAMQQFSWPKPAYKQLTET